MSLSSSYSQSAQRPWIRIRGWHGNSLQRIHCKCTFAHREKRLSCLQNSTLITISATLSSIKNIFYTCAVTGVSTSTIDGFDCRRVDKRQKRNLNKLFRNEVRARRLPDDGVTPPHPTTPHLIPSHPIPHQPSPQCDLIKCWTKRVTRNWLNGVKPVVSMIAWWRRRHQQQQQQPKIAPAADFFERVEHTIGLSSWWRHERENPIKVINELVVELWQEVKYVDNTNWRARIKFVTFREISSWCHQRPKLITSWTCYFHLGEFRCNKYFRKSVDWWIVWYLLKGDSAVRSEIPPSVA